MNPLLAAAVLLLSLFLIRQIQVSLYWYKRYLEAKTAERPAAKNQWVISYRDGKAERQFTSTADTESKAMAEFIRSGKSYTMIVSTTHG